MTKRWSTTRRRVIAQTYSLIFAATRKLDPQLKRSTLKELLRIAPLRMVNKEDADSGQWLYWDADKQEKITQPFTNHAMVYIVDDKAFYIGSHRYTHVICRRSAFSSRMQQKRT